MLAGVGPIDLDPEHQKVTIPFTSQALKRVQGSRTLSCELVATVVVAVVVVIGFVIVVLLLLLRLLL